MIDKRRMPPARSSSANRGPSVSQLKIDSNYLIGAVMGSTTPVRILLPAAALTGGPALAENSGDAPLAVVIALSDVGSAPLTDHIEIHFQTSGGSTFINVAIDKPVLVILGPGKKIFGSARTLGLGRTVAVFQASIDVESYYG